MFLSLDGTFAIQIVNFVVFFALLNFVFLKPAGRAIAARRARIDAIAADHSSALLEARKLRADGESRRLAVRRESEETIALARTEAGNEAAVISTTAANDARDRIERARTTVAGELAEAERREDVIVDALAVQLLDRALGAAR